MTFRQALLAKVGPIVCGIIATAPSDALKNELKRIILHNLSDIATSGEATEETEGNEDDCRMFSPLCTTTTIQQFMKPPSI